MLDIHRVKGGSVVKQKTYLLELLFKNDQVWTFCGSSDTFGMLTEAEKWSTMWCVCNDVIVVRFSYVSNIISYMVYIYI